MSHNLCCKCGKTFSVKGFEHRSICPACNFWDRAGVSGEDDCWLWTGPIRQSGYGAAVMSFSGGKKETHAHRISWILKNGTIPEGLFVLHRCDDRYPVGDITNRRCVNPAHLKLGTHEENMADCDANNRRNAASGKLNGMNTHPERRARGERSGARKHPERIPRGDRHGSKTHPERVARGERSGARKHPERMARGEKHGNSKLTEALVVEIRASKENNKQIARRLNVSSSLISMVKNRKIWQHI